MKFSHLLGRTAVAFWLALPLNAQAEPRQLAGVAYEELVRGDPNSNEPMPLLIAFHYSGGSAEETFEHYDQVPGPVRILAPLGAYPKRAGRSYFPVDYYQRTLEEQFRIARGTVAGLTPFIQAAEALYGSRPVVSGISQGGDISFLLAVYHPETVAAAFPLAAVIPEGLSVSPDRARTLGPCIVMMQGEADAIVDVSRTRDRVASLQADLPLSLTTYPDVGHDISPRMKVDYSVLIDKALRHAVNPTLEPMACDYPPNE